MALYSQLPDDIVADNAVIDNQFQNDNDNINIESNTTTKFKSSSSSSSSHSSDVQNNGNDFNNNMYDGADAIEL